MTRCAICGNVLGENEILEETYTGFGLHICGLCREKFEVVNRAAGQEEAAYQTACAALLADERKGRSQATHRLLTDYCKNRWDAENGKEACSESTEAGTDSVPSDGQSLEDHASIGSGRDGGKAEAGQEGSTPTSGEPKDGHADRAQTAGEPETGHADSAQTSGKPEDGYADSAQTAGELEAGCTDSGIGREMKTAAGDGSGTDNGNGKADTGNGQADRKPGPDRPTAEEVIRRIYGFEGYGQTGENPGKDLKYSNVPFISRILGVVIFLGGAALSVFMGSQYKHVTLDYDSGMGLTAEYNFMVAVFGSLAFLACGLLIIFAGEYFHHQSIRTQMMEKLYGKVYDKLYGKPDEDKPEDGENV